MYLKSFLKVYKDQDYFMNNNIEIYCATFKSILTSLKIQNILNNYIRYYWFLAGLLKKMWFKLMKKHDINSQNFFTIKFKKLYDDVQKRASKLKHKHSLNKVMDKEMLQKLNQ